MVSSAILVACLGSISLNAADLLSDFAGLVHDNERRWRVFRTRVEQIVAALPP